MTSVSKTSFGEFNGMEASLYTVDSGCLRASFTDAGASIVGLCFPSKRGETVNTVLRYGSLSGYMLGSSFIGATVGRYAGRIGGASFELEGKRYSLEKNEGRNHLHGLFPFRRFAAEPMPNGVCFSLTSPDGDEGFPGRLDLKVFYTLEGSVLRIVYEAESDAPTVFNPTNHSYFNLNGRGRIDGHLLRVFSEKYLEIDSEMIPTGRIMTVSKRSKLNFTEPRAIGRRAIDNSFALPAGDSLVRAAELISEETGIGMAVRTDRPSVHIYTGDFLSVDKGAAFPKRGGVCFETQHFPDSPNKPAFPSTVLIPGEKRKYSAEYEFFNI